MLNDLPADRQANACARIFVLAVQSLEDLKDAVMLVGWDADAVVLDPQKPLVALALAPT